MTRIEIKHRWHADQTLYVAQDAADLGAAAKQAVASGANLTGANLTGANLRNADLRNASLRDANLCLANLRDANLCLANLRGANLYAADLTGVVLTPEQLAQLGLEIPCVEQLDTKVLAAITSEGGILDMREWHTCNSTHCRAGWAIHLAGEAGYALEQIVSPQVAGALIYMRSTRRRVPNFRASAEEALADIRRCAAEDRS